MNLYKHQKEALQRTMLLKRMAFYLDPGLGKTFVGSEAADRLKAKITLVVCQKSKVRDWVEHYETYYSGAYDLTNKKQFKEFIENPKGVAVINYELLFRRPDLLDLKNFTLMLDESSMISNEKAKRTKFVLKMNPDNVILLSGTPTAGKYEKLWSQLRLLGWNISKRLFYQEFVVTQMREVNRSGFRIPIVVGYRNVCRLKRLLRHYGAVFMKAEDVLELPEQYEITKEVPPNRAYRTFQKNRVVKIKGRELVGDTTLTQMLYERQLCGLYSEEKMQAFQDLLESSDDRFLVFYNFTEERERLREICIRLAKPVSIIAGDIKDLSAYEECSDSVTLIQYQAGAMGINLQKSNKVIYFSLPLQSELFEQSKKRIHRIGQERTCFYWYLMCRDSIEQKIRKALIKRHDYTERLFEDEDF